MKTPQNGNLDRKTQEGSWAHDLYGRVGLFSWGSDLQENAGVLCALSSESPPSRAYQPYVLIGSVKIVPDRDSEACVPSREAIQRINAAIGPDLLLG